MKIIFDKKFIFNVMQIFSSYGIFIIFSILSQLYAVKFFSGEVSKLYLYLIAIYGWGSFLGEAGFSRYDVSTQNYDQSLLHKIYIKKFVCHCILIFLGCIFIFESFKILNILGFVALLILFLFSSFFLPSNILKKGFNKITYLPNLIFVISLFISFRYFSYGSLDINKILIINSICTAIIFFLLFIKINKKFSVNYKNINILKFENKRIKNLSLVAYLGCGIGLCLFFLISNLHENSAYLLFTRLSDGMNSIFALIALVCIKNNILKQWKNIIWLTTLSIISSLLLLFFMLLLDKTIDLYGAMLPIFIYYTTQISGIFIAATLSQYKKEKHFNILIKLNVISLTLSLLILYLTKINLINTWQFNIYLYFLSFLNFIPLFIFSKISYKLSNDK